LRNHRQPRCSLVLSALAFATVALGMSLTFSVPAALAAGPGNAQANELVRLINGERAAHGKAALSTDSFLAAKARDGAVACPNDATKVMYGRARDFAVYGVGANAHALRLCPSYTSMDAMAEWGYRGARGEIMALNGGYGTTKVTYTYGCTPSLRTCPGSATSTYHTTDVAMWDWTSSSTHYAIIVGSYDRVGCGAWIGSNGAYYYDCMFSRGGPSRPKAATRPAGTSAAAASSAASPTTAAASVVPGATLYIPVDPAAEPTAVVEGIQPDAAGSPGPNAALAGTDQAGSNGDDSAGSSGAPATTRNLSVAAGAITAIFSLLYGLLMSLKRRRPSHRLVA
jgi:hypothetical protein